MRPHWGQALGCNQGAGSPASCAENSSFKSRLHDCCSSPCSPQTLFPASTEPGAPRTWRGVSRPPSAPVPAAGRVGWTLRAPPGPRRRARGGCSGGRTRLGRAERLPGCPRRGGTKLCLSFQMRQSFWESPSPGLENKFLAWSHPPTPHTKTPQSTRRLRRHRDVPLQGRGGFRYGLVDMWL